MRNESNFQSQEDAAGKQWNIRYLEKPYLEQEGTEEVRGFVEKYGGEFKNGKTLDIGCGNGRNLRYLLKQGFDVSGMDLSETALGQLEDKLEEEGISTPLTRGSFYNLPYKDESFKAAISNNVFQHNDYEGARRSFSEAARVLKYSGLFFVSIRSTSRELPKEREDIPDRGITFIPKEGSKASIKIHHYSKEELVDLAKENGMEILEMREVIREKDESDPKSERKGHWIVVLRKKEA